MSKKLLFIIILIFLSGGCVNQNIIQSNFTKIVSNQKIIENLQILNDKVYWIGSDDGSRKIFSYDLKTNQLNVLSYFKENVNKFLINEKYIVVWGGEKKYHVGKLYVMDKVNNKEMVYNLPLLKDFNIFGDKIVYSNLGDIYLLNLTENKTIRITDDTLLQSNPKIVGDNLFWQEFDSINRKFDLIYYNLKSNTKKSVNHNLRVASNFDTDGKNIVFEGINQDRFIKNIYNYNIKEKKLTQVSFDNTDNINPSVSNNHLVYVHCKEKEKNFKETTFVYQTCHESDIALYDLDTGDSKKITNDNKFHNSPIISDKKIIWKGNISHSVKNNTWIFNMNIYLYNIR